MKTCYIGLGGNQRTTYPVMQQALLALANEEGIDNVRTSRLYSTTPVSDLVQPRYLNAVAQVSTTLSLHQLWQLLRNLEKKMGKMPSTLKNAPRLIDLDLLFFGDTIFVSPKLTIPHPRWHLRLFVLAPLADLVDTIPLPIPIHIKEFMTCFQNPFQEQITLLNDRLNFDAKN